MQQGSKRPESIISPELKKQISEATILQRDIEFFRYKQDCRKRALDIAVDKQWSAGKDHTLKLADELYQWLINLPA